MRHTVLEAQNHRTKRYDIKLNECVDVEFGWNSVILKVDWSAVVGALSSAFVQRAKYRLRICDCVLHAPYSVHTYWTAQMALLVFLFIKFLFNIFVVASVAVVVILVLLVSNHFRVWNSAHGNSSFRSFLKRLDLVLLLLHFRSGSRFHENNLRNIQTYVERTYCITRVVVSVRLFVNKQKCVSYFFGLNLIFSVFAYVYLNRQTDMQTDTKGKNESLPPIEIYGNVSLSKERNDKNVVNISNCIESHVW